MDIKPIAPGTGLPLSGPEEPLNGTQLRQTEAPQVAPSEAGQPFSDLTAQYQRSDLQDPAKVETMLSQCVNQLLGTALGRVQGQLPEADTQYLSDWLQNDPSVRTKLLSCLQQVLK